MVPGQQKQWCQDSKNNNGAGTTMTLYHHNKGVPFFAPWSWLLCREIGTLDQLIIAVQQGGWIPMEQQQSN
jgi:hypothetical protein